MLSGGLDSTLAGRMMLEQGIEVYAINFVSVFCTCTRRNASCPAAKTAAAQLGVPLRVENTSEEFLPLVKSPRHGYGRNLNPCLDCRILGFKRARRYMVEIGADFLTTGEVLGERPMSQRLDAMRLIDREAEVEGLVLRPLSAKLLPPTQAELKGYVAREKLLAIKGRSRKEQIRLAADFGINDYPCPAGGCLLTDKGFANRVRDLMKYSPDFGVHDVILLKTGRHFRLSPEAKLIVGRDEEQNNRLEKLAVAGDLLLVPTSIPGATGLLRGSRPGMLAVLDRAASIVAHYGKGRNLPRVQLEVREAGEHQSVLQLIETKPEISIPNMI